MRARPRPDRTLSCAHWSRFSFCDKNLSFHDRTRAKRVVDSGITKYSIIYMPVRRVLGPTQLAPAMTRIGVGLFDK